MSNSANSLHFPSFQWFKQGQQVNQAGQGIVATAATQKVEQKTWEFMYDHLNFSRRGIYFPQR